MNSNTEEKEKTITEIRNKIKDIVDLYAKYYNKKIDDNQSISAERIEKMLTNELFIGLDKDKEPQAEFFYEKFDRVFVFDPKASSIDFSNNDDVIIVDNISIFSVCEHHFLPFIGKATFKYLPAVYVNDQQCDNWSLHSLFKKFRDHREFREKNKNNIKITTKIIGLSKIPRIIDYLARKPQTQERLTMEIFDKFSKILGTEDISISMTCEHLCAKMRGIKDDITMTTSKNGGIFLDK